MEFDLKKYKREVEYDDADKIYIARAPEIKGAVIHGDTPEEALANLNDVMVDCLEANAERELERMDGISKFLLRMPYGMKRELAKRSSEVNKSINELLLEYINRGLESYGRKSAVARVTKRSGTIVGKHILPMPIKNAPRAKKRA
jgi:predicted RNase H-like HicB family nuclease